MICWEFLTLLLQLLMAGDNIPEESSHSGENGTTAATQPRRVSQGTAETLQDIMVGEDYGVTVPAKSFDDVEHATTSVPGITTNSRSRTYWQPPMDRYFIELMQEQVRKGSRIDGVFRKQAWMEMIASFNAKFGFNYDMDVLKNRHKTLKRQYNVIKNLLELDGFIWDDARQMVTADDYVWQDYIKVCISSSAACLFNGRLYYYVLPVHNISVEFYLFSRRLKCVNFTCLGSPNIILFHTLEFEENIVMVTCRNILMHGSS